MQNSNTYALTTNFVDLNAGNIWNTNSGFTGTQYNLVNYIGQLLTVTIGGASYPYDWVADESSGSTNYYLQLNSDGVSGNYKKDDGTEEGTWAYDGTNISFTATVGASFGLYSASAPALTNKIVSNISVTNQNFNSPPSLPWDSARSYYYLFQRYISTSEGFRPYYITTNLTPDEDALNGLEGTVYTQSGSDYEGGWTLDPATGVWSSQITLDSFSMTTSTTPILLTNAIQYATSQNYVSGGVTYAIPTDGEQYGGTAQDFGTTDVETTSYPTKYLGCGNASDYDDTITLIAGNQYDDENDAFSADNGNGWRIEDDSDNYRMEIYRRSDNVVLLTITKPKNEITNVGWSLIRCDTVSGITINSDDNDSDISNVTVNAYITQSSQSNGEGRDGVDTDLQTGVTYNLYTSADTSGTAYDQGRFRTFPNSDIDTTRAYLPKHQLLMTNIKLTMDNLEKIRDWYRNTEVYDGTKIKRSEILKDKEYFFTNMDLGRGNDGEVDITNATASENTTGLKPVIPQYLRDQGVIGTDSGTSDNINRGATCPRLNTQIVNFEDGNTWYKSASFTSTEYTFVKKFGGVVKIVNDEYKFDWAVTPNNGGSLYYLKNNNNKISGEYKNGNGTESGKWSYDESKINMEADQEGYSFVMYSKTPPKINQAVEQRLKIYTRWNDDYNSTIVDPNMLNFTHCYGDTLTIEEFKKQYDEEYKFCISQNVGIVPFKAKDGTLRIGFELYEDYINEEIFKIQNLTYAIYSPSTTDHDYVSVINNDSPTVPESGDDYGYSAIYQQLMNFLNIGASKPTMTYSNDLSRFSFSYFHTPQYFDKKTEGGATAQLGDEIAIIFDNHDNIICPTFPVARSRGQDVGGRNTGINDSQSGIFLHSVFFQKVADKIIQSSTDPLAVKMTRDNFYNSFWFKLGYSFFDMQPIRFLFKSFHQNRFQKFSYNNTAQDIRKGSLVPFTTNGFLSINNMPSMNLFTTISGSSTPDADAGTPIFGLGYNNNQMVAVECESATLFPSSLPFNISTGYLRIHTDLPCDTLSYRGGGGELPVIGSALLNYASSSQFFYSYAMNYTATITKDVLINSVRVEIRTDRGELVAGLGDRSLVVLKIERAFQQTITPNPELEELKAIKNLLLKEEKAKKEQTTKRSEAKAEESVPVSIEVPEEIRGLYMSSEFDREIARDPSRAWDIYKKWKRGRNPREMSEARTMMEEDKKRPDARTKQQRKIIREAQEQRELGRQIIKFKEAQEEMKRSTEKLGGGK